MPISVLSLILAMNSALAATPADSMIGDWDLGPGSTALRISYKDTSDIFVQYCDRDTLLNQHICNAAVILYFAYSQTGQDFVHDDTSSQHLHATLQLDTADPTVIHYTFTSTVGTGALSGKKIAAR